MNAATAVALAPEEYREKAKSENTRRAYAGAFGRFDAWASARYLSCLPAEPEDVATYLTGLANEGASVATVRLTRAAIAYTHTEASFDDPTRDPVVVQTLKGIARERGVAPKQATPLTEADAVAICAAASEQQWRKWRLDVALVTVMRDGLLRRSEAAALTWRDTMPATDGSGRILIRRSKSDQEGEGAVVYIRKDTAGHLREWKRDEARKMNRSLVFGISAQTICRRIARAAAAAGLEGVYSGHSPRIGMAQDLAQAGVEMPALVTAGRWSSPVMPARYIANTEAGRGAVAQVFGGES